MGTTFKITCAHCGAQFDHYTDAGYGVLPPCAGCGEYIETEQPIRCPVCLHKLNDTAENFNRQVEVSYLWN